MKQVTMKGSCGDLDRGTVLELASESTGLWQQLTAGTSVETLAILAKDVDDQTATQLAWVYITGKYRETDLIWPASITTLQKYAAIYKMQRAGILIDEAVLSVSTTTTTTTSTTTSTTSSTTTTTSTTTAP
jgi:predicted secreted protein